MRELSRFVEKGGTLLVTTDSGRFDENNRPTETLDSVLPAEIGDERAVSADYSGTLLRKPELFSRGNALRAKDKAEVLFSFPDNKPACVRGSVGRGEAVVLGMPLAALRATANEAQLKLVSHLLDGRVSLISHPADGKFIAITFLPKRGDGRIFMVFNGNKTAAKMRVEACGDEAEAKYVLADIVTGERVPFDVKDGKLAFDLPVRLVGGGRGADAKTPGKGRSERGGTDGGRKEVPAGRAATGCGRPTVAQHAAV